METITVRVNDKSVSLAEQSTITDLIRHINIPPKGIAIALNLPPDDNVAFMEQQHSREVIPQKQWDTYTLADQQDILIIKATQGG